MEPDAQVSYHIRFQCRPDGQHYTYDTLRTEEEVRTRYAEMKDWITQTYRATRVWMERREVIHTVTPLDP